MTRKFTTKEFIKKVNKIHKNRYDYSKVEYLNNNTKVLISCNKCRRKFLQVPGSHLMGIGCPSCGYKIQADKRTFSQTKVIEEFKKIHGDKYDYSKIKYVNTNTKVKIICKIHGEFVQIPKHHKNGRGCRKCGRIISAIKQIKSFDKVIEDFKKVHEDKYDYSKVEYVNNSTNITIVCPIHNEFKQTPAAHLKSGCNKCGIDSSAEKQTLSREEIITKFKKVHGNKYDYSKINYRGNHKDIDIYCKKCDRYFAQRPSVHKRGGGCKVCSSKEGKYHFKKTKEEFISGASIKHRNKYDYSKVIYNNDRSKVIIICSEHGKIKQSAGEHYRGKVPYCCSPSKPVMLEEWKERANKKHFYHYRYDKVGETYKNKDSIVTIICPKHGDFYKHAGTHIGKQRPGGCYFCKTSRGEIIVKKILNKNKINFTYQKTFPGMKYINELECDFYLKDFNTVIEYNGEQHYKSNDFFGGINGFIEQQKRDKIKYEYLEKMKIKLIIVKYNISENDVESYILNKLNSK